jgi:hypothetical protein
MNKKSFLYKQEGHYFQAVKVSSYWLIIIGRL